MSHYLHKDIYYCYLCIALWRTIAVHMSGETETPDDGHVFFIR
ncbi:hypothetical protein B4168_2473 [Anoxybacillus flavithermus]|nr:hypothetical protein B4168_2473 [Anoxybacillus flavithermus]OAO85307.1 hypothetical protein GT23_2998 [Parageobacillus thermoglucosidasius]